MARPVMSKAHGADSRGHSRSLAWREAVRGNVLSALISGPHSPQPYVCDSQQRQDVCGCLHRRNARGERVQKQQCGGLSSGPGSFTALLSDSA